MSRDTPAQALQYSEEFDQEDGFFHATPLARLAANLDVRRKLLDAPDTKRDFSPVHAMNRFNAPVRLPDAMRAEVEQLLVRVMEASGSSKVAIEEGLLRNLAFTASLDSLPLFERLLEYTRPRDQFTTKRRTWVIAGIALLAKRHRSSEAARQLEVMLRANPDKRLRVAAVDAVARLWRTADGELDADALSLLTDVARDDRDFEPRFAARGWLATMEADPIDPGEVEVPAFKATSARVPRTIEVLTTHTLVDLVSAVVSAFSWDHDHLWALKLSAEFDQEDFYVSPEGDPWEVDDGPAAAPLGARGVPVGHRFELIYNLVRQHRVALQRVATAPSPKPRAKYPRVAASVG
ncbi:MAG: hypothetical protein Q8S73_26280 [Deltaproteobacteria bacterium]|nr:hypothetical protein [Myxococcales bacterium]MDP3217643.1 hypothetical protein [Deltaproteobacteria bacterium]